MTVRVVTAAQAAERDRAAIAAGVPSRALMGRAGAAAAAEIAHRVRDRLTSGVAVFAGPGNNGGDAWVVAAALAASGVAVRVVVAVPAKTDDARAERERALPVLGELRSGGGGELLVVDGVLGTGSSGKPRGGAAAAISAINGLRAAGAAVVALDVPSGVDATAGVPDGAEVVRADLTLTFGAMKRGLLAARDVCGRIAVLDIGLGADAALDDGAAELVDARWVAERVPRFAAEAHKGTRKKLAIVGGGDGMMGAAILSARAAALSGVGVVRVVVAPTNVMIAQTAAYETLARPWPTNDDAFDEAVGGFADGVVLGPGLGRSAETREVAERVLRLWRGPVVVDADALNCFEGETDLLAELLAGRPALITPHPAEFGRLTGMTVPEVLEARFDAGVELARALGAVVLLKGVPTVISAPDGSRLVMAGGTPALGAAGSGDVLSGIAGTLLAQLEDPLAAGACASWAHGRTGELAGAQLPVRGVALGDVIAALARVWTPPARPRRYPVLAELPAVGGR